MAHFRLATFALALSLLSIPVHAQIAVKYWEGGVVPIDFAPDVPVHLRPMVFEACWHWRNAGPGSEVNCVPYTNQAARLKVTVTYPECFSGYGAPSYGGETTLNLGISGCWGMRTVIHELGHALGMFHQHQRADRDVYVEYHPENTFAPGQFTIVSSWAPPTPYDYASVMHYNNYQATKPGHPPTLVPKQPYPLPLGNSQVPTALDGQILQWMYGPQVPIRPSLWKATVGQPVTVGWTWCYQAAYWTITAGTTPGGTDLLNHAYLGQATSTTGWLPVGVTVYVRVWANGVTPSNEIAVYIPPVPEIRYIHITGRDVEVGYASPAGTATLVVRDGNWNVLYELPMTGGRLNVSNVPPGFYNLQIRSGSVWGASTLGTIIW